MARWGVARYLGKNEKKLRFLRFSIFVLFYPIFYRRGEDACENMHVK